MKERELLIGKKIKKFLFELLYFFIGFIVRVLFSMVFEKYTGLFIRIYNMIFISYFTLKLLSVSSFLLEKRGLRKLEKSLISQSNNQLLYEWLGKGEFDNSYFFQITNVTRKSNLLENLREIKKKFKNIVGSSIGDYYLLKNYIEVYEKNNILDKFSTIFLGVIVATLTAVLTKIGTSKAVIYKINDFIINSNYNGTTETISKILDIYTTVIIILSLIIYCLGEFTKGKRRMELIKSIINSIIEEKENN